MKHKLPTILVASADSDTIDKINEVLDGHGYITISVNSGREAVRSVQRRDVAVAIIDTQLTDFKGYQIAPIIKEIDPTVRVIITTSEHSDTVEKAVRQTEIAYYAIKSDGYKDILDAVRTAVESRRKETSRMA